MRRDAPRWTVVALVTLLLATTCAPLAPPPSPSGVPVTDADLQVVDEHVVTGVEVYDRIRVTSSGTLVIPGEASIQGNSMTLEGSAELRLEGGTLYIQGDASGVASITGVCYSLTATSGSEVLVRGRDGTSFVDESRGADALLSIEAKGPIDLRDASVRVVAGDGHSPGEPWTDQGLVGAYYCGGKASMTLQCSGSGTESRVRIAGCIIEVLGGDGGSAPDGRPPTESGTGAGGGFSDGGPVGGLVGAGGSADATIKGTRVELGTTNLSVVGGEGGDAGDGGGCGPDRGRGGGGGGYSGGEGGGKWAAAPGGRVFGDVGSGGDATLSVQAVHYQQVDTGVIVQAGGGGDAGDGGAAAGEGGGGGGGFSAGGGGSSSYSIGGGGADDLTSGAMGGTVEDRVGSGGDAEVQLMADEDVRFEGSTLWVLAGAGGAAGQGGASTGGAGGGGGGFSAGGGSGTEMAPGYTASPMAGGDGGPVEDRVACGGDAALRINASAGHFEDCDVRTIAGAGGAGGRAGRSCQDPDNDVWMGGGGGGSYSSGGGGGYSGSSSNPRYGGEAMLVAGEVGDGGDSSLRVEVLTPFIHRDNLFSSSEGEGGLCWRSTAAGRTGGEGGGRFTRDGRSHAFVPVGTTILLSPINGHASMDVPNFTWLPVAGSSANGDLVEYSVEFSIDENFDRIAMKTSVKGTTLTIFTMEKLSYYWRVTPLYSRPFPKAGIPSQAFQFTHLNAPPEVDAIPHQNISVKENHRIDLEPYIRDPDDPLQDLFIQCDHPNRLPSEGLTLFLRYERGAPPHLIHFNVSDGIDMTPGVVAVTVIDDNHAPYIISVGDMTPPSSEPLVIRLREDETLKFLVKTFDRDNDDVTLALITGWDGIALDGTTKNLEVSSDVGDVGVYTAVLIATDGRGGKDVVNLTVKVGNVGEPPEPPRFPLPVNGSVYNQGDAVLFHIRVYDPDFEYGETDNLTVISNISGVLVDTEVGGDLTFTTDRLGAGHHRITAILVDEDVTFREDVYVVVIGKPGKASVWDPPDFLLPVLLLLAMSVVLLFVSYIVGYRRRKRLGAP